MAAIRTIGFIGIGNMGLASSYPGTVDSVPPAIHGGNIDDRRIGKGATMYYPVQVCFPPF